MSCFVAVKGSPRILIMPSAGAGLGGAGSQCPCWLSSKSDSGTKVATTLLPENVRLLSARCAAMAPAWHATHRTIQRKAGLGERAVVERPLHRDGARLARRTPHD
eukprot:5428255-Pyramimonas_sp.AAC.1